jgi:RNA polymerase sigma-70 factor (ECF subfamily)
VDELTQLALAAGTGDRLATTAFVRRTQPEVWRVCARLGDRSVADDLTQEVYVRALPALAGFRGESSARTWLLQIARYVCADHVRGRTRRRSLMDRLVAREAGGGVSPERTGELDLDDLIGRLDPDRRDAFVLTQVAGLSYAEAAMVCVVPVGTIRSRVARARADLLDGLIDERGSDSGS